MAHARKLLRHALVAALRDRTAAGPRVEATRIDPYRAGQLPAIAVYTPDEDIDEDSALTAPRELWRRPAVKIAAFVAHSDAYPADDAMDDLAEQIEAAIDLDPNLGDTSGDGGLILRRTETAIQGGDTDPLVGIVTLTYVAVYRTSPAVSALDDFLRAGATTQRDGAAANNTISDLVTVQESP